MKAWNLHEIGKIQLDEVEMPKLGEEEVLVQVKAAGICGSDIPRAYQNGAHKMPLIIGHEFSGLVVKDGAFDSDVKDINSSETVENTIQNGTSEQISFLGKRVGIFPLIPCKKCRPCLEGKYEMCRHYSYLGSRQNGGFAEYVAVPKWNLVELPGNVSYQAAAMLEPMAVAVHAMRRVNIKDSDTVVVCGLGTIGLLLTMFLLERGLKNVYVIGNKESQRKNAMELGLASANYCDSKHSDVKDWIMRHTDGYGADVFFECVGRNDTISQAIDFVAPGGSVCLVGNPASDMMLEQNVYWKILRHQLQVTGTWNSSYGSETDDWKYVLERLEKGTIHPEKFISHQFSMEDLEQGFHIMRDRTEEYIKIMMVNM